MNILITGGTGYIGQHVTQLAQRKAYTVFSMSRTPPLNLSMRWITYHLNEVNVPPFPDNVRAVIHLAANTASSTHLNEHDELDAAKRLLVATLAAHAKFIFVSSQSAHPDAPTAYGRTKWLIEQEVLAAGGWVIRPGLVYGGHEDGLFKKLLALVKRFPILPALMPAPNVQPIHVNDLAAGVFNLIENDIIPPGILHLASPNPMPFHLFLSHIAARYLGYKRYFLPMPASWMHSLQFFLAKTSILTNAKLAQLQSLLQLPVMDTAGDLARLNLSLRPFPAKQHQRRKALLEGRALLTYILKKSPDNGSLRRYTQVIDKLRDGHSVNLPTWVLNHPACIALFDNPAWKTRKNYDELLWRLDAATLILEASRKSVPHFINTHARAKPWSSLIQISRALLAETGWRIARFLLTPWLNSVMKSTGTTTHDA